MVTVCSWICGVHLGKYTPKKDIIPSHHLQQKTHPNAKPVKMLLKDPFLHVSSSRAMDISRDLVGEP